MTTAPIDINRADKRPAHHIPTTGGHWRYSDGTPNFQRGVYRQVDESQIPGGWAFMAPLPYVMERIQRRDGDGRRHSVEMRLSMDPDGSDAVLVDADDIRMGRWPTRLDVAVPTDRRIMDATNTALDAAARAEGVPRREAAPRWIKGELHYPPADVGPTGYMRHAPDEDRARAAWAELAQIMARSPRLALVVGATLGGLYVAPLKLRQGWIVQMVGEARQGKTTGLTLGGAVLGDPGHCHETEDGIAVGGGVVETWSATAVGVLQHMGDLGVYPALYDEIGAAGLGSQRRHQLILQLAEGGDRRLGGRRGRSSRGPMWRSVMISTGNESITAGVTDEAAHARVVEVPTPITTSVADAERVPELVALAYGWPMRWLTERGTDVEGMRAAMLRAQRALDMPEGGVPRTLARHLSLAIAGAERLAQVIGTDVDLGAVATEAGAELLRNMVAELEERGITPGARLLAAMRQEVATRPGAYPPVELYRAALRTNADPAIRGMVNADAVRGVLMDGPGDYVAVFTEKAREISEAAGLGDPTPALRTLRRLGRLDTGGDADGRLRKRVTIAGRRAECYVISLQEDDEPSPGPEDPPPPPGPSRPEPPQGTGGDDGSAPSAPSDDEPAGPETAPPAAVPAPRSAPDAHHTDTGPQGHPAAPARPTAPAGPRDTDTTTGDAVINTPGGAQRPDRRPRPAAPQHGQVVVVTADADTLYLGSLTPGGTTDAKGRPVLIPQVRPVEAGTLTSDLGRLLDHLATVMPGGGTLALDETAADALGWPHDPETELAVLAPMPDRPRCYAEAAKHDWHTGKPVRGWTTWERGTRWSYKTHVKGGHVRDHVSITVAVLPWMHPSFMGTGTNPLLAHTDDPLQACYLMVRASQLMGSPWAYGAGSTLAMTMRAKWWERDGKPRSRPGQSRAPLRLVPREVDDKGRPVGPQYPGYSLPDTGLSWIDPRYADGGPGEYVITYDSIAQHLGIITGQKFAIDGPVELPDVKWDPNVPGLWWLDGGPYRAACGLPLALQDAQGAGGWVHTEVVKVLQEREMVGDTFRAPAWVPVDKDTGQVTRGSQIFKGLGVLLSEGLQAIPVDTDDPLEARVREAIKSSYKESSGQLTKHKLIRRPDWSMSILGGAKAQILRRVFRVYDATGQWPIQVKTDALSYVTEGPDPEKNNPAPEILKFDPTRTKPGFVKDDFAGTMAEYLSKRDGKA